MDRTNKSFWYLVCTHCYINDKGSTRDLFQSAGDFYPEKAIEKLLRNLPENFVEASIGDSMVVAIHQYVVYQQKDLDFLLKSLIQTQLQPLLSETFSSDDIFVLDESGNNFYRSSLVRRIIKRITPIIKDELGKALESNQVSSGTATNSVSVVLDNVSDWIKLSEEGLEGRIIYQVFTRYKDGTLLTTKSFSEVIEWCENNPYENYQVELVLVETH